MISNISQLIDTLPRAENRVASYIVQHQHGVLNLTLAELARDTAVSEPSVLRFCRRLGMSGYSDFKLQLAKTLGDDSNYVHADVNAEDNLAQITEKIFGRSIRELKRGQASLSQAAIKHAVTAMDNALRIEFYGIGASGYVIADAQNKFFRLGKPCIAYHDLPTIKQATAIADENYCCVFVSKTGNSVTLAESCSIASENGAQTIAITATDSTLANCSNTQIILDINEDTGAYTPMSSRLAQLVVLDILQVSLAQKMGATAKHKLRHTKRALT